MGHHSVSQRLLNHLSQWKHVRRLLTKAAASEGNRNSVSAGGFRKVCTLAAGGGYACACAIDGYVTADANLSASQALQHSGLRLADSQVEAVQRSHSAPDGGVDFNSFLRESLTPNHLHASASASTLHASTGFRSRGGRRQSQPAVTRDVLASPVRSARFMPRPQSASMVRRLGRS